MECVSNADGSIVALGCKGSGETESVVVRLINMVALFVLIGVVALRPLITETYDSSATSISRVLGDFGDPSPLRTLGFNVLILISAAAVFLTRGVRSAYGGVGGAGWFWGFGLLIIAGVVSCWFAGQKRLAINATIDWLCLPVLTLALAQLLAEPWARRMLLSAVIGSACVVSWQCYELYFVTFEETIQEYESNKEEFWAQQGVELDSSKVALFEGRMRARQATGFMPHSNVAASFLVLTGFAAAGLLAGGWRTMRRTWRSPRVLAFAGAMIVVAALFGALPLTGSRGAMLSAAVAGLLWILCSTIRVWVDRHRRALFLAAWTAMVLGALAVVSIGLYRGSLPGVSLMFRWQYWTASAGLIADHPITGVGRENFGRHYLAYKSIESPEEVANPHNLFVQVAADWGWPGVIAIILLLFGASWLIVFRPGVSYEYAARGVSRRVLCGEPQSSACAESARPEGRGSLAASQAYYTIGWLWFIGLMVLVLGVRAPLLGTDDFYYVYYMTAVAVIAWSFGYGVAWFSGNDEYGEPSSDAGNPRTISTGVAFGLLAFLIHDVINFALFVPATATVFFGLLAFPLSEHHKSNEQSTGPGPHRPLRARWWPGVGVIAALLVVLLVAVRPVASARHYLREARSHSSVWQSGRAIEEQPAYRAYAAAANADRLDPTPLIERAQWLAGVAEVAPTARLREEALTLAAGSVNSAIPRDRHNANVYRLMMNVHLRLAEVTQRESDYLSAIEAAREALARYPQDPHGLASLADAQAAAGRALKRGSLLQEALDHYRRALALDDQRIEWETLRRFQPTERTAIERKIDGLVQRPVSP